MGCTQSKEGRKEGLFNQHKEIFQNNNKKVCLRAEDDPQSPNGPSATPLDPSGPPTRSRHSPPVSRPTSEYNHHLEGLNTISATWLDRGRWTEFRLYLAQINEGNDDMDKPVLADRYAIFVELYADLLTAESRGDSGADGRVDRGAEGRGDSGAEGRGDSHQHSIAAFNRITKHEEDFFGRTRCLKCLDAGSRGEVVRAIKSVNQGTRQPAAEVFNTVYPKVVDKLSELLGNYQNSIIEKTKNAEQR